MLEYFSNVAFPALLSKFNHFALDIMPLCPHTRFHLILKGIECEVGVRQFWKMDDACADESLRGEVSELYQKWTGLACLKESSDMIFLRSIGILRTEGRVFSGLLIGMLNLDGFHSAAFCEPKSLKEVDGQTVFPDSFRNLSLLSWGSSSRRGEERTF